MNNEMLKQELMKRIGDEYSNLIKELRKSTPMEVIDRCYEKVIKEEMTYIFENKCFGTMELKSLLKSKDILAQCYNEWLKCDGNINEILDYPVNKTIQHMVNDYKKAKSKESR